MSSITTAVSITDKIEYTLLLTMQNPLLPKELWGIVIHYCSQEHINLNNSVYNVNCYEIYKFPEYVSYFLSTSVEVEDNLATSVTAEIILFMNFLLRTNHVIRQPYIDGIYYVIETWAGEFFRMNITGCIFVTSYKELEYIRLLLEYGFNIPDNEVTVMYPNHILTLTTDDKTILTSYLGNKPFGVYDTVSDSVYDTVSDSVYDTVSDTEYNTVYDTCVDKKKIDKCLSFNKEEFEELSLHNFAIYVTPRESSEHIRNKEPNKSHYFVQYNPFNP